MKTDRLIALLLYLQTHDTTSAQKLATRFEVTKRTILRDLDTLCQAGVPIVSTLGKSGGSKIMDGYTIDMSLLKPKDYARMLAGLEGLASATGDASAKDALRKISKAALPVHRVVFMNLSATQENERVKLLLPALERAAEQGNTVRIRYSDVKQRISERVVDPLFLQLEWNIWYLMAYCHMRDDLRRFKLARILSCEETGEQFDPSDYDEDYEKLAADFDIPLMEIALGCKQSVREPVLEYFNGKIVSESENEFLYFMYVHENERMWYSLLLGFGDNIEVISPDWLRDRIKQTAQGLMGLYERK